MTPAEILADLPEWRDSAVTELSGGLTNRSWLVAANGRKAVLKVDESPRSSPYNSRHDEARIQSAAAEAELANPVIFAADTVYMTEYVEGTVWAPDCLEKHDNLERLGRALRALHSLPLTGRTFDARHAARSYAKQIQGADQDLLQSSLRVVDAMPAPQNLCCCHNDLVAGNIIATPDIRFLDWEYACDNDPFFDLATLAAHHRLSHDHRNYLLDAYFGGDGARWRDRLGMYERFYTAILWAMDDGAKRVRNAGQVVLQGAEPSRMPPADSSCMNSRIALATGECAPLLTTYCAAPGV